MHYFTAYYIARLMICAGLGIVAWLLYPKILTGVRLGLAFRPMAPAPTPLSRRTRDGRIVTVGDCFACRKPDGTPSRGTEREAVSVDFDIFLLVPIPGVTTAGLDRLRFTADEILTYFVPVDRLPLAWSEPGAEDAWPLDISGVVVRAAVEVPEDERRTLGPVEPMERISEPMTKVWAGRVSR